MIVHETPAITTTTTTTNSDPPVSPPLEQTETIEETRARAENYRAMTPAEALAVFRRIMAGEFRR